MTDLLKRISVEVHCDQCGNFILGADVIAQSQQLLATGCPGSTHECPPSQLANLLPQSALTRLESAWHDLEEGSPSTVKLSINTPPPRTHADDKNSCGCVDRWEDDGGHGQ